MNNKKLEFFEEQFTSEEKQILTRYFTNTDLPVFGLINMPEVVKGALFARYSRTNKSLRRLFLDEFYKDIESIDNVSTSNNEAAGEKRASKLYDRVFIQYGDDSVAQLGGAHLACEQCSNLLAKAIERGRLAAYLEQSTRYVYYNQKIEGSYKYFIPTEIKHSSLTESYSGYCDLLFDTYTSLVDELVPILKQKFPQSDQSSRAWENTIKAKACDTVRGLLPASTRTNLGVYANGQAYEMMLIKMFANPLEEVRLYAKLMLQELRKIIPAFLKRVDIPDRGQLWTKYISEINAEMDMVGYQSAMRKNAKEQNSIYVDLVDWDKNATEKVLASALYEHSNLSFEELIRLVKSLDESEKNKIADIYFGERKNRRHKPGRALETIFYCFDIISDYGAFRDLQRHRMLTIQWQRISPNQGYVVPDELQRYPELKQAFEGVINKVKPVYNALVREYGPYVGQYIVPFAFNMRYMLNLNLREAYHFIELRSQKQGHPSYRKICIDMYNLITQKAGHSFFTDNMKFVDTDYHELSRDDAERRIDKKLV